MESLREMVTEALEEVKDRKEDAKREAFMEALGDYTQAVKDGLRQCNYHYEFKDEYVRIEFNGLTAASAFKADLFTKPKTSTMLNIIGTDRQLASRYRKAKMLIQALEEASLDDLNDAVGERLQELEERVDEACRAYVDSRGEGSQGIKQMLEKILNRLTHDGKANVKFYDINIAHPDDEDIITQACDINIHVGDITYTFKYVVPLMSKEFFDKSVADFCATNDLSNDMVTTLKNLYTLRCCLEMTINHAGVIGSEYRMWFSGVYSNVVDMYYKDNELLSSFMGGVYLKRPDNTKSYCFTNS
jgi:hypothetical protein|nr:MAG TPA: hypothetical protein [Caudoviricetes sp.]